MFIECNYINFPNYFNNLIIRMTGCPRRQETLKTIDQIHQEAEMEAIQEKEMMRSLQPVSGKQYQRDEKKRGKEGGHFHLCIYRTTCEGPGHKF